MDQNTRQLSYYLLQESDCEQCKSNIEFQRFKLRETQNDDFVGDYRCPSCDACFNINIQIREENAKMEFVDSSGEKTRTSVTPLSVIRQSQSSVQELVKEMHTLRDTWDILSENFDRLTELEDKFPSAIEQAMGRSRQELLASIPTKDLILDFERSDSSKSLQIEIHNYLSAAYSFDQTLETIRPKVDWSSEVNSQFDDYLAQKKVVLGLRHYMQHESVFPIALRKQVVGQIELAL